MITDALAQEYYTALVNKDPSYEGVFYVGVKTTGVLCRSICPANKPKFENCEFFSTPQEVLSASYRCCKRCKPFSHPDLVADSVGTLIDAVEAEPHKHWKTQDFQHAYPEALANESRFKRRFNMTFIEYARLRRIGLAMKHVRANRILSSGVNDVFSEFMPAVPEIQGIEALRIAWLPTALGPMVAIADDKGLYLLEFVDRRALETEIRNLRTKKERPILPGKNRIIEQIETELNEYFAGRRASFDTPLHLIGSDFQQSIWRQLQMIPIGETRTYSDIAKAVEKPGSARAVGRANGDNQLAIVIPCHRIINTNGDLGGYGGGLERKQKLLELERRIALSLAPQSLESKSHTGKAIAHFFAADVASSRKRSRQGPVSTNTP